MSVRVDNILSSYKSIGKLYASSGFVKNLLSDYGIYISDENSRRLEILRLEHSTLNKITCRDKESKDRITYDFNGYVAEENEPSIYAVAISKANKEDTFITETYYQVTNSKPGTSQQERASLSWNNPSAIIRTRTYFDVITKYGPLCVLLEERPENNEATYIPCRRVAIFHGSHKDVIPREQHNFNYKEHCLFEWVSYDDKQQSEKCLTEYESYSYNNPKTSIRLNNGNYLCKKDTQKLSGVILFDGTSSIDKDHPLHDTVNDEQCDSRAYFMHDSTIVAILKTGSEVGIEIRSVLPSHERIVNHVGIIPSNTIGNLSSSDIETCIKLIPALPVDEDLKEFISNNLSCYLNINGKDPISLNKDIFESLLKKVNENKENKTLASFAESILDKISTTIMIPVGKIIGEVPKPNNIKEIKQ